ncbi:MAG: pilus assembly protein [Silicimonas sp.]|nr:pilus assembly protein [Silicimonas sp.]
MHRIPNILKRFRRDESGVALVEFSVFLPLFLLSFFVVVEFSRIFFSYQGAIVGVRDAARYLARVAEADICVTEPATPNNGTVTFAGSTTIAEGIVERTMYNESDVLPNNVSLTSVAVLVRCIVEPGEYRQANIPIVTVTANISITLPLGAILEFNGQPLLPPITPTIIDESRVFGV